MKNIILIAITVMMCIGVATATASTKKESKRATTEFLTDIDCGHCVDKIMKNVPFERGVKDVAVDLSTKVATITYDAKKCSVESLIKAFSKIDVEAKVLTEEHKKTLCAGSTCCSGH